MKQFYSALVCFFFIHSLSCQEMTDYNYQRASNNNVGFMTFFQGSFIFNDFDNFKSILGEYNTDLMNLSGGTYDFGFGVSYKKWSVGFGFGYFRRQDEVKDSLSQHLNTTRYTLNFGYNIVNNKHFLITPKIAIQWSRYRLINNSQDKISLGQYVNERNLDLRFNQLTASIGLNVSYKFYTYNFLPSDYWTIGIYGGYLFKLNSTPWVYSASKRLTNGRKIDIKNYTIGMYCSFNIE